MAFSDCIVVAIAGSRRNYPRFSRDTAQVGLGYDVAIDLSIDAIKLIESLDRHRDVVLLEIAATGLAVCLIAQAKHRMRHWSKRRLTRVHPIELNS
jgi:hypothetical protein